MHRHLKLTAILTALVLLLSAASGCARSQPDAEQVLQSAQTVSQWLDSFGFDETLWQGALMDLMESLTVDGAQIYSKNSGVFFDDSLGGGYYASSTIYDFGDDWQSSADGTRASYYIYLRLRADLDAPIYPFGVTIGSHIRTVLRQFGVSSVRNCPVTNGVCTLLEQDGFTVTLRNLAADGSSILWIEFSETYSYPLSDGRTGTMTRVVTFQYSTSDQKLQQLSIELHDDYPLS